MDELRSDVVIVGAGPGGATLAALLSSRGVSVTILDRSTFPRDKVCGEFLSWDALPVLDAIGALEILDERGARRIDRCAIMLGDREYRFGFPGEARGISRRTLDEVILDRARALGATVMEGWSATRVEPRKNEDGFVLAKGRSGAEMKINAGILVGAWGRWGRLDIQLQRQFVRETRRRHFGFKRHYSELPVDDRTIRLHSFDRGYLGVSPVEGERTNICGLVHGSRIRSMKGGWESLVESLREEADELDRLFREREPRQEEFLSSEPVVFSAREPVVEGMLLIGDAAGIIDPLAGNGMAMAIQSALLAAGTVLQRLSGGRLAEVADRLYAKNFSEWFDSRIRWSRRSAMVLSRPSLLRAAGSLAPGPALGEFLTRKTRGQVADVNRLLDAWQRSSGAVWSKRA